MKNLTDFRKTVETGMDPRLGPHVKAFKNPVASRQVPASGSPRFGLFTVIIKQSQTVTGPKTLSCVKQLYTAQQLGVRRSHYSVQKIYIRLDMIGHVHH